MLFSGNGWVQSFGSRCVRPPIIWADVSLDHAMTTREFKVAQDLTKKPVKGMLTGPITILNWSFPRADISRKEQAFQIALALRKEIAYLEEAGCQVIQVDEPALREAMPMRPQGREEYLTWAVDAFRLATAGAKYFEVFWLFNIIGEAIPQLIISCMFINFKGQWKFSYFDTTNPSAFNNDMLIFSTILSVASIISGTVKGIKSILSIRKRLNKKKNQEEIPLEELEFLNVAKITESS